MASPAQIQADVNRLSAEGRSFTFIQEYLQANYSPADMQAWVDAGVAARQGTGELEGGPPVAGTAETLAPLAAALGGVGLIAPGMSYLTAGAQAAAAAGAGLLTRYLMGGEGGGVSAAATDAEAEAGARLPVTPEAMGASEYSAVIDALVQLGFSPDEAANLLANDPKIAIELLQDAGISGLGGGGGGGGGGYAPTQMSMITGADGSVFAWNPVTASLVNVGKFPELATRPDLSLEVDMNGNLVGIDPKSGEITTLQEGFSFPGQDPAESIIRNAMTGESIKVNSRTGETTSLGQFDFPDIDPEREFSRLVSGTEAANEVARRGATLTEQKEVSRLLSSPTDFLARAFATRGEEFSGTKMTQADLINALRGRVDEDIVRSDLSRLVNTEFGGSFTPPPPPAVTTPPVTTPVVTPPPAEVVPTGGFAPNQNNWTKGPDGKWTTVAPPFEYGGRLQGVGVVGDSSDGKENREVVIGDAIVIPEDEANRMGIQTSHMPEHQDGGTIGTVYGVPDVKGYQASQGPSQVLFTGQEGDQWEMLNGKFVPYTPPPAPTPPAPVEAYEPSAPAPTPTYNTRLPAPEVTQEEIVAMVRAASPPAVSNLVEGRGEETRGLDLGFKAFSPRQTARLTDDEIQALGTRLAAEFDVTLNDVASQQQQLYGPTRSARRGRLIT